MVNTNKPKRTCSICGKTPIWGHMCRTCFEKGKHYSPSTSRAQHRAYLRRVSFLKMIARGGEINDRA